MRGTLVAVALSLWYTGIIPALAGNTDGVLAASKRLRDHPRACGEHDDGDVLASSEEGSSPRLRGTLPHGLADLADLGIIPALAGNTL